MKSLSTLFFASTALILSYCTSVQQKVSVRDLIFPLKYTSEEISNAHVKMLAVSESLFLNEDVIDSVYVDSLTQEKTSIKKRYMFTDHDAALEIVLKDKGRINKYYYAQDTADILELRFFTYFKNSTHEWTVIDNKLDGPSIGDSIRSGTVGKTSTIAITNKSYPFFIDIYCSVAQQAINAVTRVRRFKNSANLRKYFEEYEKLK